MNIFIIVTPLQILNAVEAQQHFELKPEECMLCIIQGGNVINFLQLAKVTDINDWGEIVLIPSTDPPLKNSKDNWFVTLSKRIKRFDSIKDIIKSLPEIDHVFLGEYRSELMRHFANSLRCRELYLLDDGNITIRMHEGRGKENDIITRHVGYSKSKNLVKRLIGLKDQPVKNLNYFTAYDLKPILNEKIVRNEYRYLRSHLKQFTRLDCIYFLGTELQSLFEEPMVKDDIYYRYLKRIKEYFSGQEVIYFPHRAEPIEKQNFIESELNIKVKRLNIPIENYLANTSQLPRYLAGFYSSALYNGSIIFGSDIHIIAFSIKKEHISQSFRDEITNVYGFYRMSHLEKFDVIDLEEV
ncbi:hypothetical protein ACFL1R_00925 [Candidatus Latescibacterota bacterium]